MPKVCERRPKNDVGRFCTNRNDLKGRSQKKTWFFKKCGRQRRPKRSSNFRSPTPCFWTTLLAFHYFWPFVKWPQIWPLKKRGILKNTCWKMIQKGAPNMVRIWSISIEKPPGRPLLLCTPLRFFAHGTSQRPPFDATRCPQELHPKTIPKSMRT